MKMEGWGSKWRTEGTKSYFQGKTAEEVVAVW